MTDTASHQHVLIRSARFRQEREATWRTLEALVGKAERYGLTSLSFEDVTRLTDSYRQTINALSAARAISMDKGLLDYLEALSARAYLVIYSPHEGFAQQTWYALSRGIPQAVRRSIIPIIIGFFSIIAGIALGYFLFTQDTSWFYTFVPGGLADGRVPGASTGYLRETLFPPEDEFLFRPGSQTGFATFLFSHNTRITFLVFALGVFAILPSFILSFYNGLILGAFVAMFAEAGLLLEVFGWLSIHGVTELSAICIGCAGGTQLGLAVVAPGNLSVKEALRQRSYDAVRLVILAIIMLFVAAILEGYFRDDLQSTPLRIGIGWGIGLFWFVWLAFAGREARK